jgi:hypothetical protein
MGDLDMTSVAGSIALVNTEDAGEMPGFNRTAA